jgi:glutathione S-transferase
MNLYTSCGPTKVVEVHALEKLYDESLGVAACNFFYIDMLIFTKWRSILPFALMGFKNRVGLLQSLIWFALSPILGRWLMSVMNMKSSGHQEAMQICRETFRHASESGLIFSPISYDLWQSNLSLKIQYLKSPCILLGII